LINQAMIEGLKADSNSLILHLLRAPKNSLKLISY
jgi:hypothetical protein